MIDVFTDNIDINISPFKGPFKGKGANRKAIQILQDDQEKIRAVMRSIVKDYNTVMPEEKNRGNKDLLRRPYLGVVSPAGVPQLWWRRPDRSSRMIHLFGSVEGDKILSKFLPNTIMVFQDFDMLRVHWNLKAMFVGRNLAHYVKYMDELAILESYGAKLDKSICRERDIIDVV